MTIDERILFLVQSTESLHQTVAEMVDRWDQEHNAHERERREQRDALAKHQRAILRAIQAYLDALSNGGAPQ